MNVLKLVMNWLYCFKDGTYVEKAMLLKSKVGGELTKHQTKQLECAKK